MNPSSALRANLGAIKDLFGNFLALSKAGLLFAAILTASLVLPYEAPWHPFRKGTMTIIADLAPWALGVLLSLIAFGYLLNQTDRKLFNNHDTPAVPPAIEMFKAVFYSLLLAGGAIAFAVIVMLLAAGPIASILHLAAPSPRFTLTSLGSTHPWTELASSQKVAVVGVLALLSPLLVRLPLLMPLVVLDHMSTAAAWELVIRTTRGKGIVLLVVELVQAAPLILAIGLFTGTGRHLPIGLWWAGYDAAGTALFFVLALITGMLTSVMLVSNTRHFFGLEDSSADDTVDIVVKDVEAEKLPVLDTAPEDVVPVFEQSTIGTPAPEPAAFLGGPPQPLSEASGNPFPPPAPEPEAAADEEAGPDAAENEHPSEPQAVPELPELPADVPPVSLDRPDERFVPPPAFGEGAAVSSPLAGLQPSVVRTPAAAAKNPFAELSTQPDDEEEPSRDPFAGLMSREQPGQP